MNKEWRDYHRNKEWRVSFYKISQAYGGPEEGGWFYTCGEFSHTVKTFSKKHMADTCVEQIRESIKEGNHWGISLAHNQMGHGPMDGVDPDGFGDDRYLMSGGHWGDEKLVVIAENHKGKDFPSERPFYE